jgi:hypothetical protein
MPAAQNCRPIPQINQEVSSSQILQVSLTSQVTKLSYEALNHQFLLSAVMGWVN